MVSVYTLSGRPAFNRTIVSLLCLWLYVLARMEWISMHIPDHVVAVVTQSAAQLSSPVIASMRSDTARSSPCRLNCRMASAEGGPPPSAKLRRTSASSPLVEADAPVWISLVSRG